MWPVLVFAYHDHHTPSLLRSSDGFPSQSAGFPRLNTISPKLLLSPYFLPLSSFVTLLQPHWPAWCSSSKLSKLMFRNLVFAVLSVWNTCFYRHPWGLFPHFIRGSAQMSPQQKGFTWHGTTTPLFSVPFSSSFFIALIITWHYIYTECGLSLR